MEDGAGHTREVPTRMVAILFASRLALIACFFAGVVYAGDHFIDKWNGGALSSVDYAQAGFQAADGGSCSIAVVPLAGDLYTTQADAAYDPAATGSAAVADDVVAEISAAKADDSIKGVVLQVDSLGGSAVAGEMIAHALKTLGKPSVALIRESGDSAAYLASSGASRIIASPYSDVGDIGITGSYVQNAQQDANQGLQFIQISAGTYKDAGNPDKPITAAEKALLQRNVDDDYVTFVDQVAENRGMATSTVRTLADGSSMSGSRALGTGLIDQLGGIDDAQAWLAHQIGNGSAVLCQ